MYVYVFMGTCVQMHVYIESILSVSLTGPLSMPCVAYITIFFSYASTTRFVSIYVVICIGMYYKDIERVSLRVSPSDRREFRQIENNCNHAFKANMNEPIAFQNVARHRFW